MKLVFFGTSAFAVPPLQALVAAGMVPVLVVTQHLRPAGRGQHLRLSPVAACAQAAGIPIADPEQVASSQVVQSIRAENPDLFVVVAYGQKLSNELLALPRLGAYNIHGSVLPLLRGAAPIQRALIHGMRDTGVTMLEITDRMDAGPIIAQATTPIGAEETAGELHDRLAIMGAKLLVEQIPLLLAGRAAHTPQDESRATRAPKLTKEEGHVDFAALAKAIACRVRGLTPWPGAYCFHQPADKPRLRLVLRRVAATDRTVSQPPGTVMAVAPVLEVACQTGTLELRELMREGRSALSAEAFLRGYPMHVGDILQ